MARPVKETPILKGKEAIRFEARIKENEKRKVPRDQYHRAIEAFNSVKPQIPSR